MKSRSFSIYAIVIMCFIISLSGCNKKEETSSDEQTITTIATAPPLLKFDISKLLTPEQVGNALGVVVGEGRLADQNTTVRYSSEDELSYIEIRIMESNRKIYDETAALYADAVDTLNLGQAAKWSPESKQLLVFDGEYMIGVTVFTDRSNDDLLVAARHIAALVIEKI